MESNPVRLNYAYQWLQLVVSYLSDERVALGLVFWDGASLRWHLAPERIPAWFDGKRDIELTVDALRTTLGRATAMATPGAELRQVVALRPGDGSALVWSDIRRGVTKVPESTFRQLLHDTYLVRRPSRPLPPGPPPSSGDR